MNSGDSEFFTGGCCGDGVQGGGLYNDFKAEYAGGNMLKAGLTGAAIACLVVVIFFLILSAIGSAFSSEFAGTILMLNGWASVGLVGSLGALMALDAWASWNKNKADQAAAALAAPQ